MRNLKTFDCFAKPMREEDFFAAGAIISDGSLSKGNSLNFWSKDLDFVEKVKNIIAPDAQTKTRKSETRFAKNRNKWVTDKERYYFSVGCTTLVPRLHELGIYYDKSHNCTVVDELKPNKTFWRTMIDGDGCVSMSGRACIELVGTQGVCLPFADYCRKLVPHDAVHVYDYSYHPKASPGAEHFQAHITKREHVLTLMRHFYENAPEHLRMKRKYETVMNFLEADKVREAQKAQEEA